eukprot:356754-Chlamydomonas_euryale.AAC.8
MSPRESPHPLFGCLVRLCDRIVLVDRRLHEALLERGDAVLQLLDLGADARQLLVGACKLVVRLGERRTLRRNDLAGARCSGGPTERRGEREETSAATRQQGHGACQGWFRGLGANHSHQVAFGAQGGGPILARWT